MSNLEHISPEGFRLDGRRVHEPRAVRCSIGSFGRCNADGYAVFELGNTKAIAYVYGPMETRRAQTFYNRASLTCTLSTAAFATPSRTWRTKGDRQSQERSMWIQQTFESAILLDQYPRSQIRLFIQLVQSDGGGVSAAINASTLALADAGIPTRDLVVACSVGMLGRRPAVDLSREEENAGGAQILLGALAGSRQVSLLEVESKVPEGQFPAMYDMAMAGCEAIAEQMRARLMEHATQNFSLRMSLRSGQKS
mmetsp:Transcript_14642/g.41861  ORF Transcript_14642/g.41861 Transcript_14642/m.41861 type:complete len:253 (+) Transcript_14642:141-899(+)